MGKLQLSEEQISINEPPISQKISSALNVFWFGFIVYTSAYTISVIPPYNNFWGKFQLFGVLLIVIASFSLIKLQIENIYLRSIYILYLGWLCFIIARGIELNFGAIQLSIYDAWFGILPYFVPLILLFPKNIIYLRKIFSVIAILGIVYLGYCLLYRKDLLAFYEESTKNKFIMEYFARELSVPSGFLLITYIYHSKKRKALALIVVTVTLLLAVIRARRAIMFMEMSYLISFYFFFLYVKKIRLQVLLFSLVLIGALVFVTITFYNKYENSAFQSISERIDEDTRTGVEECLYKDMTITNWIIGKGMKGEYYCPGIDEDTYTDYRGMIETDYLNIILKGGLISLGLLLLITIPAVIKGMFYSKNLLSKAAGVWILLWLLDLYPTVVDIFGLHYLLVWICIGICFSQEIRNMSEEEIKRILVLKKIEAS